MKLESIITFAAVFVLLVIYTPILILLFGWFLLAECAVWAMRDRP